MSTCWTCILLLSAALSEDQASPALPGVVTSGYQLDYSDKTKSREQRSLVLCLPLVAISSPGLVLLWTQWASNSWRTHLDLDTQKHTHTETMKHKHSKSRTLINSTPSWSPTTHPQPHTTHSRLSTSCHRPNLILPRFSVSFVSNMNSKNKTLTLISVFLAVFAPLQPTP